MAGPDPICLGIDLPAITMTTFVDFVVAGSGTPKLTAVKNAKARYERGYDSTEDFYKLLRKCIAETARQNSKGSETLDTVRSTLVKLDRRKLNAYQECGEGYKDGEDERTSFGTKISILRILLSGAMIVWSYASNRKLAF